jgi:hypothetical protein
VAPVSAAQAKARTILPGIGMKNIGGFGDAILMDARVENGDDSPDG